MMRVGSKNVVLKCGCVTTDYGRITVLGEGHDIQACDKHDGWYRIIREANFNDQFRFYFYRIPAPARASNKPPKDVLGMSGGFEETNTKRSRNVQPVLF